MGRNIKSHINTINILKNEKIKLFISDDVFTMNYSALKIKTSQIGTIHMSLLFLP